jgi:hypothetical protein
MSAADSSFLRRAHRVTLLLVVAGFVCSAVFGWIDHAAFGPCYRFAGIACLEPAVGSLIFLLIYRSTGGQWGEPLLPFLGAGVRLLPWCWLALLPLLWLNPNPPRPLPSGQPALHIYISEAAVVVRAIGYTIIFLIFRWVLDPVLRYAQSRPPLVLSQVANPLNPESDPADRPMALSPNIFPRWIGPVGLIILTFMMHLLAVDWLLATEPDWTSTGFPLVWLSGQAVAGLALAVAVAISAGVNPGHRGPTGNAFGIDWGNLLLTTIMFWIYVAFVQLLIIWSGNLPRETSWYLHRWHGGWRALLIAIVCFHFVIPFFLLLSRELKRRASSLRAIAVLVVIAQTAYVGWMILPSYSLSGLSEYALALATLAGGGGLFLNRYFAHLRPRPILASSAK